ncbi:hypothetical protein [Staphylococcus muscae]|uniref:hypothetical protein n=1 Tax=Staphylococcus muscae TaxID=1294 RepID=UPI001474E428|nr:hypothetical protein [Staphylococcus muscae]
MIKNIVSGGTMKLSKFEYMLLLLITTEFILCFLFINHLTIFQYMIFVQIIPSILSAFFIGRIAARSRFKWLVILTSSIVFVIVIISILNVTPISTIENNTVQSKTSVILFNRNMKIGTYFGLFFKNFC